MRVVVTAPAERDLEGIFDYIAADSPRNAKKYIGELRKRIKGIGRFPLIHPLRGDLQTDLRTASHGSHVIVFRIAEKIVEVIRVVHGARDLLALFGQ